MESVFLHGSARSTSDFHDEEFGYAHRLTARYNSTKSETNQATLDDDPVDIYSYDHLWRVRTVTEATHTQQGWTSFVREQWFYHTGSDPTSYKIGSDAPVMRRIDTNGDGTFDETQNFVTDRQGSVVKILGDAVPVNVNDESQGMKPGEVIAHVRYDTYGVPTICDPADINRDGAVDQDDMDLYIAYWQAWMLNNPISPRYKEIADFDRDGTVDTDTAAGTDDPHPTNNADFAAFAARFFAVTFEPDLLPNERLGNLPLYAGYWWDAQLEMYHVRHRVYRPEWGKWIQRDPLGYAAGWNLYEYVGGEPWRGVDPSGLDLFQNEVTIRGTKEGRAGTYHHKYDRGTFYFFKYEYNEEHSYFVPDPDEDFFQTVDEVRNDRVSGMNKVGRAAGCAAGAAEASGDAAKLAAEVAASELCEPIDWALTITYIYDDPTSLASYAGLLPFVPAAAGKVAKESAEQGAKLAKDAKKGPVSPGQDGTYGELKAQKKCNGETEPMDMDHQPSFAAQKAAKEAELDRPLTPAEEAVLRANTPAVASPRAIHQETSPTYGGRNTPAQIEQDRLDRDAARARDRAILDEALRNR